MISLKNRCGVLFLCSVFLFCFCGNPTSSNGDKNKGSTNAVTISGTLKKGLGKVKSGMDDADSIYATQVINGMIDIPGDKSPKAIIHADGTFDIQLDKIGKDAQGNDVDLDWVLILFNSKATTRFNKIVGFLALKEIDASLIKFPISKAKGDSLKMGNVTQHGDEALGDTTAKDTAKFSLTLTQLKEMAHTGRTLKIIKNIYASWDPTSQKNIQIKTNYSLGNKHLIDAQDKELKPESYFDSSAFGFSFQICPNTSPNFNYDQLHNISATVDLYPPAGSNMYIINTLINGQSVVAPVTSCISTDTATSPHIVHDTTGSKAPANIMVVSAGSGTPYMNLFCPTFKGMPPNGVWDLKANRSTIITQFDAGLGNPVDTLTGKPLVYVPSLEVDVDHSDSTIHQVIVKWYYWDSQAHQYIQASDAGLLQNNVTSVSIQVFDQQNLVAGQAGKPGESYTAGSSTPVPLTITFTPTQHTWPYKDPTTYDEKLGVTVGYTSMGQDFGLNVVGHKITQ